MKPIEIVGTRLCIPAQGATIAVGITLKVQRTGKKSVFVTLASPTLNGDYLCFAITPELAGFKAGRYDGYISGLNCAMCVPLSINCK
jgi:hypothetical protein